MVRTGRVASHAFIRVARHCAAQARYVAHMAYFGKGGVVHDLVAWAASLQALTNLIIGRIGLQNAVCLA